MSKIIYGKKSEYTVANTYTMPIKNEGIYEIELIGGGGGSAYVDGGTDSYSDTAWANHYGHSGGNGGIFVGFAKLSKGSLSITIGTVGTNRAGKGNTDGNGEDSYIIFTPENGEPIEIVRASGGKSGYPTGSNYKENVSGGIVTFNPDYIVKVTKKETGSDGILKWSKKI